jgi:hypothetical protein
VEVSSDETRQSQAGDQTPSDIRLNRADSQRSTASSASEKASVIDNSEIVAKAQLVQTEGTQPDLHKTPELPADPKPIKVRKFRMQRVVKKSQIKNTKRF